MKQFIATVQLCTLQPTIQEFKFSLFETESLFNSEVVEVEIVRHIVKKNLENIQIIQEWPIN